MVGRVLAIRKVAVREGEHYKLIGYSDLSGTTIQQLMAACDGKLAEYVARRSDAVWQHRRRSAGYISCRLRYEVLKAVKFRCELCGVSADERALEVDHVTPTFGR